MKTDPQRINDLERKAALGRLQELEFVGGNVRNSDGVGLAEGETAAVFAGQSVTIAVQFALESLGWMEFTNGPDNDYGPATIEAVARAQEHYGRDPTRWLSHSDARQMICDAAIEKRDPASLYHLGVMFSRGWGFPIDLVRARFAISQADIALEEKLADAALLPDWKLRSYYGFRPRIAAAKTNIEAAWSVLPEAETAGWRGRLSTDKLCE
jgi:peptidoglycan hydrolase-like protein with peptidoglycan-binding domain